MWCKPSRRNRVKFAPEPGARNRRTFGETSASRPSSVNRTADAGRHKVSSFVD